MDFIHTLYGDGIHDDTFALQERIDSGIRRLVLPAPQKHYLISRPLVLPSHFSLVLPRDAEVRLKDNSNCVMVKNRTRLFPACRLSEDMEDIFRHILAYVDDLDPDFPCENIEIIGGIWNCNNMGQNPNPMKTRDFSIRTYPGFGMLFYNVKDLKISSLTVKDAVNYGIVLDKASDFLVSDITFDYNRGNPLPITMDGIHVCGNSHHGIIRKLRGACYDDMVALNADDGSHGPVSHITVEDLYAENCHSAVRMLAVHNRVENICVSDIKGTYFQYCVGITKYFPGVCDGGFSDIIIQDLSVSKAPRTDDVYPYPWCEQYPVIWFEDGIKAEKVCIRNLCRKESVNAIETVSVGKSAVINDLHLENIHTENLLSSPMPLLVNRGRINKLSVSEISGESCIINQ